MPDGYTEHAAWFGPAGSLLGVTCLAEAPAASQPPVILMNPGTLHRVGVGRFNVRLARALARAGIASFRFDFSGLGDSDPREDGLSFRDSAVDELRLAMDEMARETGASSFVLCGLCTGSAMSFEAAVADERVVGAVLIEGYAFPTWKYRVRRWAPELLSRDSWYGLLTGRTFVRPALRRLARRLRGEAAMEEEARARSQVFAYDLPTREHVRRGLETMARRGVRLLMVFGGGEHHYYNYRAQFEESFRDVDFRGLLHVAHNPGADHTFSALPNQRWLDTLILEWLGTSEAPDSEADEPRRDGPGCAAESARARTASPP